MNQEPAIEIDQLDGDRLQRLFEVALRLGAEGGPEEVQEDLLREACELTGARYAAIGVLDDSGSRLRPELFRSRGVEESTAREIDENPRGLGVLGVLIRSPGTLRLADLGRHEKSYGLPLAHPEMHTFLGTHIAVAGKPWGILYVAEKDRGEFDAADEQMLAGLARFGGVAIANALAIDAERRDHRALEHANRALEATAEVALGLASETDTQRLLEVLAKRARALLEARLVVITLADGGDLRVTAAAGDGSEEVLDRRFPFEGSMTEAALARGYAVRIEELPTFEPRSLRGVVDPDDGIVVPLTFKGRKLGALGTLDREGHRKFGTDDLHLAEAFAASAAVVIGTSQVVTRESQLRAVEATERERTRWVRAVGGRFGRLRSLLGEARDRAEDPDLRDALDRALVEVADGSDSVRDLVADPRPATFDGVGLGPGIEALVKRIAALRDTLEFDLTLALGDRPDPPATVAEAAYLVVQESLMNVVERSAAGQVRIELVNDEIVRVTVKDDGPAGDVLPESRELGLLGLKERIDLMGGSFDVSSDEQGTTVVAELPPASA